MRYLKLILCWAFALLLFCLSVGVLAEPLIFHRDEGTAPGGDIFFITEASSASSPSEDMSPIALTFTFVGDCTLGGTEKMLRHDSGFAAYMKDRPYTYPFLHLAPFFNQDDLTLINLEGVFADSPKGLNKSKKYAFRGPTEYVSILSQSSVEAVNLSNNHTGDYGKKGMESTLNALHTQNIGYSGEGWLNVFTIKGVKVGLGGTRSNWNKEVRADLEREIEILKAQGCEVIIYSLHAGQEYGYKHNERQANIAHFLIDKGADLVIGHHPHVVQGIEQYADGYIFYSLGNCAFGGNHRPRDLRALLAQTTVVIDRQNNEKTLTPSLFPIHISGTQPANNYQPLPVTGEEADKVLDLVAKDSNIILPPYEKGRGAQLAGITKALERE